MQSELQDAQLRLDFMEQAPAQRCKNVGLAFLAAKSNSLFLKDGTPDWTAIKGFAPELFGPEIPNVGQGRGVNSPATPSININDRIRRAAGHNV
jgi:hypothetical protein